MVLHAVVGGGLELVRVEVLHYAPLPACSNRLLSSLATCPDLNMNHIVLLRPQLCVIVGRSDEDKVTGLKLVLLQSDR